MSNPIFTPRPAVIGHRGLGNGMIGAADGAGGYRENTLESCLAAVDQGATWVEVDARRSADDELVVHHNPTTPDGEFIVEQTSATVRAKGLARLSDILAAVPVEIGLDIDVKSELEDAVCERRRDTAGLLAPALAVEIGRRPLFVSSFDPAALLYLREQVPGLPVGMLTWLHFPLRHAVPAAARLGFQAVGLHVGSFGPNPIERHPALHRPPEHSIRIAHRAGLEVLAWCPDPETASRFADAGIDALCVNDIPGTLQALKGSP